MAYKVAIIGSFRKHYEKVIEIIRMLRNNGLYIMSPKGTKICGKVDEFVLFESDETDYTPEEIQMITLDKILRADVVYVCNPYGYIGRTTSYEIGFCYSRGMPIYFYSAPKDLPIPVRKEQVLKPDEFLAVIINNEEEFYFNYGLCEQAQKSATNIWDCFSDNKNESQEDKKVVICGSMQFYEEMVLCRKILAEKGINAIIPKEEADIIDACTEDEFRIFKRKVSSAYLKKIREKDTMAILVYNGEKRGIPNYIGANTLVEIAMAFTWNRRIYLYNDIYTPLADELLAWECISLNTDLQKIVIDWKGEDQKKNEEYVQLSLFDE